MQSTMYVIHSSFGVPGNCIGEDGIEELRSKLSELNHKDVLDSMSDDEGDDEDGEESEESDDQGGDDDENESEHGEEKEEVEDEKRITDKDNDLKIAEEFLSHPSLESFKTLPEANRIELVKQALKARITDVDAICRSFVQVSSVLHNADDFIPCTDLILQEAFLKSDKPETVINNLLIHLGLLKSEDKIKPASDDITGALEALDQAARQEYFPKNLAFYFIAFLAKPNFTMKCSPSARTNLQQTLEQL